MSRLARLLFITFIESFATVLVERGIYFYSHDRLGFTPAQNLWLALAIGTSYVGGALLSHRASARLGDKKLLLGLMVGHIICHATLTATPGTPTFVIANCLLATLTGAKWPLVESYITAGRSGAETANTIGKFNLAWASSVPLAMIVAGQLIAWVAPTLFALPLLVNLLVIALILPLEARPVHLPDDHPDRLSPPLERRYDALKISGRWSMMASYTLLFILVPLMPTIFAELGLGVRAATALGGLIELVRLGIFVLLWAWPGWHGKVGVLVWSAAGLPVGFFLVLFAPTLPTWFHGQPLMTVILGEIAFGAAAGAAYYAALYYAMAVNASVESGGEHESLVGSGFALGPAIGLIGVALANPLGGEMAGMLASVGPFALLSVAAALWPMRSLASRLERHNVRRADGQ